MFIKIIKSSCSNLNPPEKTGRPFKLLLYLDCESGLHINHSWKGQGYHITHRLIHKENLVWNVKKNYNSYKLLLAVKTIYGETFYSRPLWSH